MEFPRRHYDGSLRYGDTWHCECADCTGWLFLCVRSLGQDTIGTDGIWKVSVARARELTSQLRMMEA